MHRIFNSTVHVVGILGITLATLTAWNYLRSKVSTQKPSTGQSGRPSKSLRTIENLNEPAFEPSARQVHVERVTSGMLRPCLIKVDKNNHQLITIQVAHPRLSGSRLEQEYRNCKSALAEAPSDVIFEVRTTIEHGNDSESFLLDLQRLGQAFTRLATDDDRHLCHKLTVTLPMTELKSNAGVVDFILPEVRTLDWTSNRNQLPLISPISFTHLIKLDLTCELSHRDCALLLRCARKTLKDFTVATIIDREDSDDRAHAFTEETYSTLESLDLVLMKELEKLTINSVFCPSQMLRKFNFMKLKILELDVQYGALDPEKDFTTIPWVMIERTYMNCRFVTDGSKYIEKSCQVNATHTHTNSWGNL